MKRTIKAWAVWENGRGFAVAYRSREAAHRDWTVTANLGRAIPCTITYDDGKKPRKRGVKR